MRRFAAILGLLLLPILGIVAAEEGAVDPAILLANDPWPGMTSWDAWWCKELVWQAGMVEWRVPGQPPRNVRVRDARGWLKPNGFWGLRLNGQEVDEGQIWLNYAGTMTNLKVLFTYGSRPVKGVSPWRD